PQCGADTRLAASCPRQIALAFGPARGWLRWPPEYQVGDRCRLSQDHGVGKNPLAKPVAKAARTDHIDPATQDCLQIHDELAMVHEASSRLEVDDEVQVAASYRIAARDRTKHPYITRAMTTRQRDDLITALSKMVEGQVGHWSRLYLGYAASSTAATAEPAGTGFHAIRAPAAHGQDGLDHGQR